MKKTRNFILLSILIGTLISGCSDKNHTNPQWRGVNRDGIYQEKNLLKSWPETGPKLLWFTETIGKGYAAPVISNDRLFVNGEIDSISHVFAFDLNGKLIWKTPNGPEFYGTDYSANFPGARSTPTVYDGLVYVSSGLGRIACLEAKSGKEKWGINMVSDLGGKLNMFGYSESLFVDENNVYCFPGGTETNVAALDRMTGKVVWTSKAFGDPVSFISPITIQLPELRILVNVSHEYVFGVDMKDGKSLWSYKLDSVKLEGDHSNTPLFSEGYIYGVAGDENGTGAFKLELSADGKSIKEVWRNQEVMNSIGGFVKIGDKIYCTSNDNKLKCLDTKTGQVIDSLSGLRGSVIYADGRLYCYSDNGNVNLVQISGDKMQVTGKFKIDKGTKEHFSHPVIRDGVLYIRHGNALMAYEIK